MQQEQLRKPGLTIGDGIVTGALTHDRLLVIPARFWTEAKQFLEDAYGGSVNMVLNRFAQEIGRSYGKMLKGDGLKPGEVLGKMSEMASVAGWGRMEFSGDLKGGNTVEIDIANCAFCPAGAAARGGKCDFIAGVAEGMAKEVYGYDYKTGHVDASGEGGPKCRVLICKTDHPDASWKAGIFFPWLKANDPLM